jgi:hypothetical protein
MAKKSQTPSDALESGTPADPAPRILVQAEGRTVLQEDGSAWPADGIEDPDTHFTRRRLKDGDLVVADAPKTEAEGEAQ